jgi:hypothetical protein
MCWRHLVTRNKVKPSRLAHAIGARWGLQRTWEEAVDQVDLVLPALMVSQPGPYNPCVMWTSQNENSFRSYLKAELSCQLSTEYKITQPLVLSTSNQQLVSGMEERTLNGPTSRGPTSTQAGKVTSPRPKWLQNAIVLDRIRSIDHGKGHSRITCNFTTCAIWKWRMARDDMHVR